MNDRELIKNLEVLKRYVESCAASCGDKVHGHIETITVCQEMVIKRPNQVNRPDACECQASHYYREKSNNFCGACGGEL